MLNKLNTELYKFVHGGCVCSNDGEILTSVKKFNAADDAACQAYCCTQSRQNFYAMGSTDKPGDMHKCPPQATAFKYVVGVAGGAIAGGTAVWLTGCEVQ